MKRLLPLLLVVLLVATIGCTPAELHRPSNEPFPDPTGYRVADPLPYPDYTFDHAPGTLEMRLTAVRAMRDLLSVQWSTAAGIYYYKTGPVSEKFFQHQPDTTYAGVPYSNAGAGLFQFLEFYNHETGRLEYPGDADALKKDIGNSCADSVIWGLNSVCNSLSGPYYPNTMVHKNGYLPVGDYTYDYSIKSFSFLPTNQIAEANGKSVIINAYTQVLPGDVLVSTPDNHGMMAIEKAKVVFHDDGSVNTAESYVAIQDQRGGRGAGFYEQTENGQTLLFSGRTYAKFTFDELWEKGYLPVAPAEFLGMKEYSRAQVSPSNTKCTSLKALKKVQIDSNYPLAVINAILVYETGEEEVVERVLFSGAPDEGVPKRFPLDKLSYIYSSEFRDYLQRGSDYNLKIEVVVSTGQRFIATYIPL